ncbi:acyltransferase family protein [Latilactobacillus sakei subsp. sakei]|uniref:acyltransferase n=1 Tax=Latilactobacillus sakei TaxID=1599 RepID=UPI0004FFFD9C|nr:acyltransferase family protein [Latilactobacillus sakei]KGB13970.1 hypothetical protein KY41_10205 [Latilactobacillus sakei]MDR7923966.1 acyltransferase family protein [Latilactobacillus sakei subsp. sakei]USF96789.1 hypothetical protein A4W82_08165 [Latilactobacillus sakei]
MKVIKDRNYGIDIIRIISMFMVVLLHNLLQGGVLNSLDISAKPVGMVYWLIENCSIVAVNMFAIITGYLTVQKKVTFKKVFSLWKEVFFWSIFITFVFVLLGYKPNLHEILYSILPTIMKNYWYFNAYLMLVLFIPFLNIGVNNLEVQTFEKILSCLVLLSVTIGFIGHWFELDGYSGIWLIILYLIGAYLKISKKVENIKSKYLVVLYILCVLLSLVAEYISLAYIGGVNRWVSYVSPMVVISSISLFILLSRVNVRNTRIKKILSVISPLTFAVYLIDNQVMVYKYVIKNMFSNIGKMNILIGVITLLGATLLMFIVFIALEYGRVSLFALFKKRIK